jgi:hypothetical protein
MCFVGSDTSSVSQQWEDSSQVLTRPSTPPVHMQPRYAPPSRSRRARGTVARVERPLTEWWACVGTCAYLRRHNPTPRPPLSITDRPFGILRVMTSGPGSEVWICIKTSVTYKVCPVLDMTPSTRWPCRRHSTSPTCRSTPCTTPCAPSSSPNPPPTPASTTGPAPSPAPRP